MRRIIFYICFMRFITLTTNETAALEAVYLTNQNAVARRRSQCLLLSATGHSIKHLMNIFSVCRITLYNWFDRWQDEGLTSLRHRLGKGRKRLLAPIKQPVLEELVRDNPQNLKAVLHELTTQHAVECSKDTLRRHLKKRAVAF